MVCAQFYYTHQAYLQVNATLAHEIETPLDTIYFQLVDATAQGIPNEKGSRTSPTGAPTSPRRYRRWVGLLATGVSTVVNLAARAWSHFSTTKRMT